MQPVKCPDCGAYNDPHDAECAMCGKRFGPSHKQDDRKRHDETHRRKKRQFDDESDEDLDNGPGYSPRR